MTTQQSSYQSYSAVLTNDKQRIELIKLMLVNHLTQPSALSALKLEPLK